MSLRGSELTLLAGEVNRELAGAVAQKVYAPTPARVYLELRVPGRTVTLLVCAEPQVARVSVVEARPANPPQPPAWQHVLRRELTYARLRDAEALPERRSFLLHFARDERFLTLALELGTAPVVALVTGGEHPRVLCRSLPSREELKVGAQWRPLPAAPPKDAPSRLKSDQVFCRLLHGAEELFIAPEREAWLRVRRGPLERKLKQLERTREKVKADLARTALAGDFRREGELLTQNLARLKRGQTQVTVTEFLSDGSSREVLLTLDPKRSPKEEVERRFHQYRRLQRGAEQVRQRLAAVDAEEASLRAELAALETTVPALPGVVRRERRAQAAQAPYREYLGHGQKIWVGRGAAHNDALTFQHARAHHLWLHARGVPGAHVVIPLEKNVPLSSEVLVDAMHLALHHSDAKGEPRGEVSYTQVKFVRKAKAGGPGAVTFTREKTTLLRVEPERLQALLATESTPYKVS